MGGEGDYSIVDSPNSGPCPGERRALVYQKINLAHYSAFLQTFSTQLYSYLSLAQCNNMNLFLSIFIFDLEHKGQACFIVCFSPPNPFPVLLLYHYT